MVGSVRGNSLKLGSGFIGSNGLSRAISKSPKQGYQQVYIRVINKSILGYQQEYIRVISKSILGLSARVYYGYQQDYIRIISKSILGLSARVY